LGDVFAGNQSDSTGTNVMTRVDQTQWYTTNTTAWTNQSNDDCNKQLSYRRRTRATRCNQGWKNLV